MSIFSEVGPIKYEGPDSTNEYAFKAYDKDRIVLGKKLSEWLRLTVCYWHSFASGGMDTFGGNTWPRPWNVGPMTQEQANAKTDAAFDFFKRMGTPYFAFHDVDAMADANTLQEHEKALKTIEERIAKRMQETGVKLLWGTANLFGHPRFMAGAATNPNPEVFAYGAAQVRMIMEATHRLGGENYVLWGGREGYDSLLNTDMKAELEHFGRFLKMVVEHKHKIGFKGTILIEPKPFEPTKHQYDRDVSTVFGFLQKNGLEKEVKVNIEVNHATLANLDFEHEVTTAYALGIMGSLDINRGDPRSGWDTDQFPNNAQELSVAFLPILENGGLGTGGCNFDAKLRRQSVDVNDLYIAHIAGIDTLARAVLSAEAIIKDKRLATLKAQRYAGWSTPFGKEIAEGKYSLAELADIAVKKGLNPQPVSGKQELFESIVAQNQKV